MMKSTRQSPSISAVTVDEGRIMRGNDNRPWVAVTNKAGIQRWVPYKSTSLNGLKVLTLDYLEKNIGKPIKIYDREARDTWPIGRREKGMETYIFIPDGDAQLLTRKTPYKNWLVTRSPPWPEKGYIKINGVRPNTEEGDFGPIVTGGECASTNPRNIQSFVKAD